MCIILHRVNLLQELGQRIVELRRRKGLSREVLARKAGLSSRFLAEVESGRGNISLLRLSDVSAALGISLATLIGSLPPAQKNGAQRVDLYSSVLTMVSACDAKQLEEAHLWLSQRFDVRQSRIALVGLRGAGKTAIGKRVAARLHWRFLELDEQIEKAAGLTLQNIFEVHGEEYYRHLEYEVLLEFLREGHPAVIATGGGIVTREETYELLRRHCLTIWLKAEPQDHWDRVLQQDPRPMRNFPNAMEQLQTLLRRREPLYSLANFVIDTSSSEISQSVRQILRVVKLRSSRLHSG